MASQSEKNRSDVVDRVRPNRRAGDALLSRCRRGATAPKGQLPGGSSHYLNSNARPAERALLGTLGFVWLVAVRDDRDLTDDQQPATEIDRHAARRLLVEVGAFTRPCDIDLAIFFARHPRSLISAECLSAFLGYELNDIAESLDVLLAAGLLRRRQTSAHAARLYELTGEHSSEGDWLDRLTALASTRHGRLALLEELVQRAHTNADQSAPKADAAERRRPRRIVARLPRGAQRSKNG